MRTVARALPFVVLAALLDCTSFPTIPADTCGNGIVELGEDCDTFPKTGSTLCGAPGSAGACRYSCVAGAATTAPTCPAGWGCASTNICRESSGRFEAGSTPIAAGAWRLDTGDFNDDHLADVLTSEEPDVNGLSRVRVHFFDSEGALKSVNIVPTPVGSPHIADFNGDEHSDLAFANSNGVGIMLAQGDGSLVPVAYPTLTLNGDVLLFPASGAGAGGTTGFGGFGRDALGAGIRGLDAMGNEQTLVTLPAGPEALAGGLVYAKYFESTPCAETVIAYAAANTVLLYPVCKSSGSDTVFNDTGASAILTVTLADSSAKIDKGVIAGDVDGDGHLDLLVGASGQTYVAYGTGGALFHEVSALAPGAPGRDDFASLLTLTATNGNSIVITDPNFTGEELNPELPLAVGDLNRDGATDFVLPDLVMVSVPPTAAGDGGTSMPSSFVTAVYEPTASKSPNKWTQAAIADFNRDGALDLVAGSDTSLDLDYFNAGIAPFSISTDGPVGNFAVGDIDGDLYPDLAFSQSAAFGSGSDEMVVAYGQAGAPLEPPVSVGSFTHVVATRTFTFTTGMVPVNLLVMSQPALTTSVVSLLQGNGDRQPLALFSLAFQTTEGAPLGVVPAAFETPGVMDVAAFAATRTLGASSGSGPPYNLWLLRNTQSQTMVDASFSASAGPGPEFTDVSPTVTTLTATNELSNAAVLLAAADFNGDGTPDVATILPPGAVSDGSQGELFVSTPKSTGPPFAMSPGGVALALPISVEGQLLAADVDVDGAVDLVLLTGDGASTTREIVVFWNDGKGSFGPMSMSVVNASGDIPHGFWPIQLAPSEPPAIAYVTHSALQLAHVDTKTRTFHAERVAPLTLATGVVATDVNGDGVQDLAVADAENLVVFLGSAVDP